MPTIQEAEEDTIAIIASEIRLLRNKTPNSRKLPDADRKHFYQLATLLIKIRALKQPLDVEVVRTMPTDSLRGLVVWLQSQLSQREAPSGVLPQAQNQVVAPVVSVTQASEGDATRSR